MNPVRRGLEVDGTQVGGKDADEEAGVEHLDGRGDRRTARARKDNDGETERGRVGTDMRDQKTHNIPYTQNKCQSFFLYIHAYAHV